MRNIKRLFLLALTLFATCLSAAESYTSQDHDHRILIYQSGGHWILEEIARGKDSWPELVRREIFSTESAARKAIVEWSNGRPLIRSHALPKTDRELRSDNPEDVIWQAKEKWTWDWEIRFAQWIEREVDTDFMVRYGVATDCADVAYALRWIFARMHGLEMASRLSSGPLFTHRSLREEWKSLPTADEWHEDQRFRAALDYLLDMTYTHTLWEDSYPVEITPEAVLAGGYHLYLYGTSGHTQILWRIGRDPDTFPIVTINSTVPQEVRPLFTMIFTVYNTDPERSALLRFRWPDFRGQQVRLIEQEHMPHYSQEQFHGEFSSDFWRAVYARINPDFDLNLGAQGILKQLKDLYEKRVVIVEEGYAVCSRNPCRVGTPEWEKWSTPIRDGRILNNVYAYQQISPAITDWSKILPLLRSIILNLQGSDFSLEDLMWHWMNWMYSSDPNDPPAVRWGLYQYQRATR